MKKVKNIPEDDDMLPEYDFRGKKGVRGKYYRAMQQGYTVRIHHEDGTITEKRFSPSEHTVILDPDVYAYFPNSESVNKALCSLIELIPNKQIGEKKSRYTVRKKSLQKTAARK